MTVKDSKEEEGERFCDDSIRTLIIISVTTMWGEMSYMNNTLPERRNTRFSGGRVLGSLYKRPKIRASSRRIVTPDPFESDPKANPVMLNPN
jgi:hypothetical protein